MKKIVTIIFFVFILLSCEQYPEPGSLTLESFGYQKLGENQSAVAGEYLENEIGIIAYFNSEINLTPGKFYTEFVVTSGGGTIDKSIVEADSENKMTTRWKLGTEQNQQTIKGKIFDSNGKLYSEFTINATAIFLDKLNTVKRGLLVGIQDMVRDTINNRSMLISGCNIFVSKNTFYDWEQIIFPSGACPKELEINSIGEVFCGGWDGNLYKTTDWGKNWILVSKPIPDNIYYFELSISKDDLIWVSKWERGVYCSNDNGITWTKDSVGLFNQEELGRVYAYKSDSHLALSHNKLVILQTFDKGKTWSPIPTPEYSLTIFVTDENAIIAQNQGGFNLHKSTDDGMNYKKVFSPSVAYGTTSWHCYDKFKDYYYVLAPGGGVWKTKDFENFEELMKFTVQRNLFIDHTGTVYASGFNYSNAEPEPTMVLPSQN